MQYLTKKSKRVLKLWKREHSIGEIAELSKEEYNIIRNNYFKHFKRKSYLDRLSRGRYMISEKGKEKLAQDSKHLKMNSTILKLSRKKYSNKEIKKKIMEELNHEITDSSLFSKIYRLRKTYNIKRRNTKYLKDIEINEDFFEFLGLILSDGHIRKYQIEFTNKDKAILDRYKKTITQCGLDFREKLIQLEATKIIVYSLNFVNIVNRFLNNKKKLSDKLIKNKKSMQNAFLRGLYSGDGCSGISISYRKIKNKWRVEPFISLSAFNHNIRNPVFLMLRDKGYTPIMDNRNVRLIRKKDILKFSKEIRFIDGLKIRKSKYWNGLEKNKVLNYIANDINDDYNLKKLTVQIDKDNLVNYIKGRLTNM